jgi:hypothetical protein
MYYSTPERLEFTAEVIGASKQTYNFCPTWTIRTGSAAECVCMSACTYVIYGVYSIYTILFRQRVDQSIFLVTACGNSLSWLGKVWDWSVCVCEPVGTNNWRIIKADSIFLLGIYIYRYGHGMVVRRSKNGSFKNSCTYK